MKNKISTIIIILITLVLAGVAIFTAIRLYQTRNIPVAPNVPTSKPEAYGGSCSLSFTITATTPTATPTATGTATPTGTATATATSTATSTATATATSTASPTSTSTSIAQAPTTTSQPELPDAGTSWPTILGTVFGILVILGSLLLAF